MSDALTQMRCAGVVRVICFLRDSKTGLVRGERREDSNSGLLSGGETGGDDGEREGKPRV